jgi:hypothetical protein
MFFMDVLLLPTFPLHTTMMAMMVMTEMTRFIALKGASY